jgi:hypothetical protein
MKIVKNQWQNLVFLTKETSFGNPLFQKNGTPLCYNENFKRDLQLQPYNTTVF